jgi:hypothetical protein
MGSGQCPPRSGSRQSHTERARVRAATTRRFASASQRSSTEGGDRNGAAPRRTTIAVAAQELCFGVRAGIAPVYTAWRSIAPGRPTVAVVAQKLCFGVIAAIVVHTAWCSAHTRKRGHAL